MKRRWLLLFAVVVLAGLGAIYVLTRPKSVPIPTIDVSHVDAEVATAIQQAIKAVEQRPREGQTWGNLGMVLRAHDFAEESVAALQQAEAFDPRDPRWPYLQGLSILQVQPDLGVACLERALPLVPYGVLEPRLRLADLYLERGRFEDAQRLAEDVAERSSKQPHAALVLARLAAERNQWAEVLRLTEPHREHRSAQKKIARLRTEALQALGRFADAKQELQRASELPDDAGWEDDYVREVERLRVGPAAKVQAAEQLWFSGQHVAAITLLEEAASKYPKAIAPRRQLLAWLLEQGDSRRALTAANALIAVEPRSVEGWLGLGMAQLNIGDFASAKKSLRTLIEIKPDHGLAYLNLGIAHMKLGEKTEAIQAAQDAVRCRPDLESAHRLLREWQTR